MLNHLFKGDILKQSTSSLHTYLIVVSCLLGLGIVMVASSSMAIAYANYQTPFYYVIRQAIFLIAGSAGAFAISRVPMSVWAALARPLLLVAFLMLALLFVPGIGREVNGSLRWIRIGPIGLQVSEFAKLCLLMYFAAYCAQHEQALRSRPWAFLKPLIPALLMCGLIILQPDFGAVVVVMSCCMGVLFLVGVPLWSFALMVCAGLAAMAGLAVSAPYRFERLTAFLNPWADQYDSGYQLTQALIAFGRGDWFGMGLGSGVQKLLYLPEAHTDFIFAVIAEELGLFGALVVLLLYGFLALLGFKVGQQASQQGKSFHAYLAYGLSLWMGMQAFIAMGVNMGLLPTKGLTLPLISSGGSSLMITLAAIGLLVRIHIEIKS
jgi:cell division protein FtsW